MLAVAEVKGKVPAAIRNMPQLSSVDIQYINAYHFLKPSKASGLGLGLIPLSEYAAYAQLFDLPEDTETWAKVIRAIDVELDNSDNENLKPKVQRRRPTQTS